MTDGSGAYMDEAAMAGEGRRLGSQAAARQTDAGVEDAKKTRRHCALRNPNAGRQTYLITMMIAKSGMKMQDDGGSEKCRPLPASHFWPSRRL